MSSNNWHELKFMVGWLVIFTHKSHSSGMLPAMTHLIVKSLLTIELVGHCLPQSANVGLKAQHTSTHICFPESSSHPDLHLDPGVQPDVAVLSVRAPAPGFGSLHPSNHPDPKQGPRKSWIYD